MIERHRKKLNEKQKGSIEITEFSDGTYEVNVTAIHHFWQQEGDYHSALLTKGQIKQLHKLLGEILASQD